MRALGAGGRGARAANSSFLSEGMVGANLLVPPAGRRLATRLAGRLRQPGTLAVSAGRPAGGSCWLRASQVGGRHSRFPLAGVPFDSPPLQASMETSWDALQAPQMPAGAGWTARRRSSLVNADVLDTISTIASTTQQLQQVRGAALPAPQPPGAPRSRSGSSRHSCHHRMMQRWPSAPVSWPQTLARCAAAAATAAACRSSAAPAATACSCQPSTLLLEMLNWLPPPA